MDEKKNVVVKRLAQYSSLSATFLFLTNSISGQVIYTDVDPDTIFDSGSEGAYLDIDANVMMDFVVLNTSFTLTTFPYEDVINRQGILAGPFISQNSLAGISQHYSTSSGGFTSTFPYALAFGQKIDANLEWHNNGIQVLGARDILTSFINECFVCNWYNEVTPFTIDHYLGIRFLDNESNRHYGWIRCDVIDSGRTLIIKDYAYEIQPDHAILAGDTTHYVDVNEIGNMPKGNLYYQNETIVVNLENFDNHTEIIFFDINGREISSSELINGVNEINFNFPQSIYLYSISTSGKVVKAGKIANFQ